LINIKTDGDWGNLGFLDRFKKKEPEKEAKPLEGVKSTKSLTELEQLFEGDKDTYEALMSSMFLDPTRIDASMKDAVKNARKFEKEKDYVRAKVWYEVAGGLAIYEGDTEKVKEFFGKCEKISPETKYAILKNPEKAVAKAQEYYKKHLKT
jgi:hypothetical protein